MQNKRENQKVALVGVGRQGKNILHSLVALNKEIVAVLHTRNGKSENWLTENHPGIPISFDLEEVLRDQYVSHICIATPVETHKLIAEAAIRSRKAVFLEKPIALTARDGDDILRFSEEMKTPLFVGHVFLYHDCFEVLNRAIGASEVRSVTVRKTSRVADGSLSFPLFLDFFIHEIATLCALFGNATKVKYCGKGYSKIADMLGEVLYLEFGEVPVTVVLDEVREEKKRRYSFECKERRLVWENNDLYEEREGDRSLLCRPNTQPLQKELSLFLGDGDTALIAKYNRIAIDSVKILENLWSR